jgi:hypothetical protein
LETPWLVDWGWNKEFFPFAGCAFTIAAFIGIVGLIVGPGIWYALNEQGPSEQALGTAMVFY